VLVDGRKLSHLVGTFAHVFEGCGVGLTVTELGCAAPEGTLPPGVVARPSRLCEVFPTGSQSRAASALELERVQGLKAVLAAYEAHLVMDLAGHPDAAADGTAEGPIPGTSEFFVDELAMVTNSSTRAAGRLAEESFVLVERLPAVWAALADGELELPRARVFVAVLGSVPRAVAADVVARVLPEAAGLSLGRLRARLMKTLVAVDEAFVEQVRAEAERCTDVRLYPTVPGMAEVAVELPAPVAAACWSTVDELAWMRRSDGDERPIGLLRALTFADLILRPWDVSRPAVTAVLSVTAPLPSLRPAAGAGAEPGAVNGQPVTAAHVRELLAQLDAVCPGGLQAPSGGSLQIAVTGADGALLATATRPELERIARRGCPAHPDPPGQSVPDHPDRAAPSDCDCPVLDRPPPVDRYVPPPAQRRFVRARDRSCRHPGCGQPVARVDLDHVHPYGRGGPTDCDNLCCLCRRHHRLKTHAPGWRFVLTDHGVLRVTTPSGITRSTRPPGLRDRIEQRALPAPPRPPQEPEEPPPF
jgi:hypothetical protein